MPFTLDYRGAVVAITGVTSGIGFETARMFAHAGARVSGCGRSSGNSPAARRFLDTVSAAGGEGHYVSCDLERAEAPRHFVQATERRFERLDVLVSNAGRNFFAGADSCTLDEWEACFNLDLRAHWLLAEESRRLLLASAHAERPVDLGTPCVLVNSSNHALSSIPGCFPYNLAKAGLNALVQSLAIEWGPEIRSVGVAPGFIETAANQTWFDSFDNPEEERSLTESRHPVGAIGTGEQIGATFVFLASRYANFVSGTTWLADGGRSALMQDGTQPYVRRDVGSRS